MTHFEATILKTFNHKPLVVVAEVLRTSQQHDHHRNPNPIPSCKQVMRNALREEVTILEHKLTKRVETKHMVHSGVPMGLAFTQRHIRPQSEGTAGNSGAQIRQRTQTRH